MNVPLWNLNVGLSQLPNDGVGPDGVHLATSPNGAAMLDSADTVFGMNYRNLTAVEVLARVVGVVEENGAPQSTPPLPAPPAVPVSAPASAPALPATPFVVAIYQAILQRPVDTPGLALFSGELNAGISANVVVQQIWSSAEHRQLQINQYYQQYLGQARMRRVQHGGNKNSALGMNESQMQESLLMSPEYNQDHPSDSLFVEGVYQDVLDRTPSAGEEIYWEDQLETEQVR